LKLAGAGTRLASTLAFPIWASHVDLVPAPRYALHAHPGPADAGSALIFFSKMHANEGGSIVGNEGHAGEHIGEDEGIALLDVPITLA
jgi:hypothetical protein